jgi:NTE family protein
MDRHTGFRLLAGMVCTLPLGTALQAQQVAEAGTGRPRIGLVLAGGGAKGGAHVGVLKVLEELRVPVDCIAGTSMGALVGAGYASGQTAAQVEDFMLGVQWPAVIGNAGRRDLEPVGQKHSTNTYSNKLEFGLRGGRIIVPGGMVDAARIDNLLRDFVARARSETDFDRLPIPFRAVATDMVKGDMVVLGEGDLAIAMRASMAIPGAFAPVTMGEQVLSDGGMVRNVPVDVARDLCADVVIVSNLVEPEYSPEQLQTSLQLLSRSNGVMIFANETAQLATLTDRDVLIESIMGDIGTSSFERIPETVPLGEKAAHAAAVSLQRYAVSEAEYAAWRQRVTATQEVEVQLAHVEFAGLGKVNPEYLRTITRLKPGDQVDSMDISNDALRLSALRDFDSVGYRLSDDDGQVTLTWEPHEKTWGPSYLTFDLGFYTSVGGDLAFVLDAQHTRTWINPLGAQWRNDIQVGYESRAETSFYQPLEVKQHWFVEPRFRLQQTMEDLYVSGDRLARYTFRDISGGLDFGRNLGDNTQFRTGYHYTERHIQRDTGSPLLPEDGSEDSTDAGFAFTMTHDSRDRGFSATRGVAAAVEYQIMDKSLGGKRDWQRGEAAIATTLSIGKNLISTTLAGGTNFGADLPFDRLFTLGGPSSFAGYELGEVRAQEYASFTASYLHKLTDLMSLRGEAIYAGLKLQASQLYGFNPLDGAQDRDVYGASLYLTGSTPAGPLTLGYGATTTDAWSVWLAIGRPVGHGTLMERGIFR